MTNADLEAQIRRHREVQTTPLHRRPWGSGVYEWSTDEIDCLLRRLDEARAKVSELAIKLNEERAETSRLRKLLHDVRFHVEPEVG